MWRCSGGPQDTPEWGDTDLYYLAALLLNALRDYGTADWDGDDETCDHEPDAEWIERMFMANSTLASGGGKEHTQSAAARVRWYALTPGKCPRCGAIRIDMQVGIEENPDAYVTRMVSIFREVRRVLRDDGTLWLNIGDTYAGGGRGNYGQGINAGEGQYQDGSRVSYPGIKTKDLVGIPWMLAFALRADGWWLRQEIIWHKPAPMPESVTDRCTRSHESLFLLAKEKDYYFNADAIAERSRDWSSGGPGVGIKPTFHYSPENSGNEGLAALAARYKDGTQPMTRNKRDVWSIQTESFRDSHFAVMPQELVEPCILAGSLPNHFVLDPFCGSGTVGVVALRHGRKFVGIDLNEQYCQMARRRIAGPLFAGI